VRGIRQKGLGEHAKRDKKGRKEFHTRGKKKNRKKKGKISGGEKKWGRGRGVRRSTT